MHRQDDDAPNLIRLLGDSPEIDSSHSPFDELRRTRNQIENMLQVVLGDDGVLIQDFTGRIVYANDAAARILGAGHAARLKRMPAQRLLADVEIADAEGAVRSGELPGASALKSGVTHEELLCFRPRSGKATWATVRAVPMRDGNGRTMAAATVFRDVTEQRYAADLREKIIGIVSHDLKNPLSATLLSTTLIERGSEDLDPKLARLVTRIRSSSERAIRLVNDLLDLTQARLGGGIPIVRQPVDVETLAAEVVSETSAAHPTREIRVSHRGERLARWDADRVSQVLVNLLTNALLYSPSDTAVSVATVGNHASIEVAIHNQGDPIPAAQIPFLFEPFMRAKGTPRSQPQRSVGLGLYIVKMIVDAHGGRLSAESTAAAGTTFTAVLPRDAAPPQS